MDIIRAVGDLKARIDDLAARQQRTVIINPVLTSTSWDGDARSTTAKTLIDLSGVFSGTPANIRAVLVDIAIRDSGSAGGDYYLILGPNNTSGAGKVFRVSGLVNDSIHSFQAWVPCNSDGDIYYQVVASGSGTMDIWLEIAGWLL